MIIASRNSGGVFDRDASNDLVLIYDRARIRPPEGLIAWITPEVSALADNGRYAGELDAEVDHFVRRGH